MQKSHLDNQKVQNLFAILVRIFANCGDILIKSLKTNGINWLSDSETQIMMSSGHAEYLKTGQKILYELNCSQSGQSSPNTEIVIKMNKSSENFDSKFTLSNASELTDNASDNGLKTSSDVIDLDLAI